MSYKPLEPHWPDTRWREDFLLHFQDLCSNYAYDISKIDADWQPALKDKVAEMGGYIKECQDNHSINLEEFKDKWRPFYGEWVSTIVPYYLYERPKTKTYAIKSNKLSKSNVEYCRNKS